MLAHRDVLCMGSKLKANPILLSRYVFFVFFLPQCGVAQSAAGYSSLYTPRTKFPQRILKPCALSSLQRRMAIRERHTG